MFAVKAAIRPVITIAPSSAVPSEEPSCWAVFCRPPASLRSLVADRGLDDVAELGDDQAHADPEHAHRDQEGGVVELGLDRVEQQQGGDEDDRRARRGPAASAAKRLASAEPASAATKRPTEAGSIRTPVSSASRPWTICRKSGIVKKIPIRIRFWARSIETPPRSGGILQQAEVHAAVPRRAPRAGAPRPRSRRGQTPPAAITNGVSEKPKGSIGELRGRSQPQLLACRTPRTITPRPAAESDAADPVERRPCPAALGLADQPRAEQDADRDDDLAGEDDAASSARS